MAPPMLLAGRVALVTGAARGIGRVTALVLAEEGADVAVADVLGEVEAVAEEVRARGRRAAVAAFDIADDEAVREGVLRLSEALGPPGILVNNAGIVANVAPVARMTAAAWHREVGVNLSGAFHMIQATIGDMVASRWGRIVNVSSIGGTGGLHHQAAYAASKAGLLGLTKTVALEHGRRDPGSGGKCHARPAPGRARRGGPSHRVPRLRPRRLHQRRGDSHRRGAAAQHALA